MFWDLLDHLYVTRDLKRLLFFFNDTVGVRRVYKVLLEIQDLQAREDPL